MNNQSIQTKRISKEAQDMLEQRSDQYFAQPLPDDLLNWHFTIRGLKDTEFEDGLYHGRIELSNQYPYKPPNLYFTTPNGRFEVNSKICLSITKFHPESWNPSWTIRAMLEAIINHFPIQEEFAGVGALDYSIEERRKLANVSINSSCNICGSLKVILPPIEKQQQKPISNLDQEQEKDKQDKNDNIILQTQLQEQVNNDEEILQQEHQQKVGDKEYAIPQNFNWPKADSVQQLMRFLNRSHILSQIETDLNQRTILNQSKTQKESDFTQGIQYQRQYNDQFEGTIVTLRDVEQMAKMKSLVKNSIRFTPNFQLAQQEESINLQQQKQENVQSDFQQSKPEVEVESQILTTNIQKDEEKNDINANNLPVFEQSEHLNSEVKNQKQVSSIKWLNIMDIIVFLICLVLLFYVMTYYLTYF